MKKTEFKIHTIYSKEDILQMEKVSWKKMQRLSYIISGSLLILYGAIVVWETVQGVEQTSLIPFLSGTTLNIILIATLVFLLAMTIAWPYLRRRKILKTVPGGVLRANFYFYEKVFKYGWGEAFTTIPYVRVEEFRNLPKTFYIRADGVAYWVKKSDFEVGTPEEFLEFMRAKVNCGIK